MKTSIIRLVFAVTHHGIWKITARRTLNHTEKQPPHYAQVKKVFDGEGKFIKNGRILKKGAFVGIQPKKLALFYSPKALIKNTILEMPDEESCDWGCETGEQIVALFLKKREAIECSKESNLMVNDLRWEMQTESVVRLIGLDHPFFCVSTGHMDSFSNCHDLELTPEKRKTLKAYLSVAKERQELAAEEKKPKTVNTKPVSRLREVNLDLVRKAVEELESVSKPQLATVGISVEKTVPRVLPKVDPTLIEKVLPQTVKPDLSRPKDIGGGKIFVLLAERQIKLHRIFPEINNGDSLSFRPGKYELKMVQIVGNVKHYAIETTHGKMYGRSVPDLEMFCKVERTEASVVLTYK